MTKEQQLKELIDISGNGFHYKVVNFLRDRGWAVSVSPYYNDNLTDKPREIDIIAEKAFTVLDVFDKIGTVNVKLFVECKYINSDTVFWFDEKDMEKAVKMAMEATGLDDPRKNVSIEKLRTLKKAKVAKLFVTEKDKGKNQENDMIYKALNQGLNALVYYKNTESIIPSRRQGISILRTLNYPVILCNNFNLFHCLDAKSEEQHGPVRIEDSFQFEINYAYINKDKKSQTEYFIVDIVNFEKLESFLKEIMEEDVETVKQHVAWEHNFNIRNNRE